MKAFHPPLSLSYTALVFLATHYVTTTSGLSHPKNGFYLQERRRNPTESETNKGYKELHFNRNIITLPAEEELISSREEYLQIIQKLDALLVSNQSVESKMHKALCDHHGEDDKEKNKLPKPSKGDHHGHSRHRRRQQQQRKHHNFSVDHDDLTGSQEKLTEARLLTDANEASIFPRHFQAGRWGQEGRKGRGQNRKESRKRRSPAWAMQMAMVLCEEEIDPDCHNRNYSRVSKQE